MFQILDTNNNKNYVYADILRESKVCNRWSWSRSCSQVRCLGLGTGLKLCGPGLQILFLFKSLTAANAHLTRLDTYKE